MKTEVVDLGGRKVTVSELTQLKAMAAMALGGRHLDASGFADESNKQKKITEMVLYRNYPCAFSVVKIDDMDVPMPNSEADVMGLMSNFTQKQWSKILAAYTRLNEDDEETSKQNLEQ